jgi:hypothetical protein
MTLCVYARLTFGRKSALLTFGVGGGGAGIAILERLCSLFDLVVIRLYIIANQTKSTDVHKLRQQCRAYEEKVWTMIELLLELVAKKLSTRQLTTNGGRHVYTTASHSINTTP